MRNIRAKLVTGAAIGGAAIGGAAIASAATSSTSTSNSGSPTTTAPKTAPRNFPAHGSAAHENAEKPVTGTAAAKAGAAAVKSVGGGTAGEVTTDFDQKGYEVTVTKSDGSKTEVHLDSSFNVVQRGPGGPHGNCGPG
ncbi:MAG TPA: hypothetical protein VGF93_14910, partial [Solirubrobacteraceae bacterium]